MTVGHRRTWRRRSCPMSFTKANIVWGKCLYDNCDHFPRSAARLRVVPKNYRRRASLGAKASPKVFTRRRIYTLNVVLWLMLLQ